MGTAVPVGLLATKRNRGCGCFDVFVFFIAVFLVWFFGAVVFMWLFC